VNFVYRLYFLLNELDSNLDLRGRQKPANAMKAIRRNRMQESKMLDFDIESEISRELDEQVFNRIEVTASGTAKSRPDNVSVKGKEKKEKKIATIYSASDSKTISKAQSSLVSSIFLIDSHRPGLV